MLIINNKDFLYGLAYWMASRQFNLEVQGSTLLVVNFVSLIIIHNNMYVKEIKII